MALVPFDDASSAFDDLLAAFDGQVIAGCVSFDDAGTLFDDPLASFDCGASPTVTTPTQVGSRYPKDEINPETRRYWESERVRLRILRDDEEVLLLV